MPQYVRDWQMWSVDTPKMSNWVIPMKRIATTLGLHWKDQLSGTLLPKQQAVILRPHDVLLEGGSGLTADMVDDFSVEFDSRYRLRLPMSIKATLNLVSPNDTILVYGRNMDSINYKGKRRGSGQKGLPILYFFNYLQFAPEDLEKELNW